MTSDELNWINDKAYDNIECDPADLTGGTFIEDPTYYCAKLETNGPWYLIDTDSKFRKWWWFNSVQFREEHCDDANMNYVDTIEMFNEDGVTGTGTGRSFDEIYCLEHDGDHYVGISCVCALHPSRRVHANKYNVLQSPLLLASQNVEVNVDDLDTQELDWLEENIQDDECSSSDVSDTFLTQPREYCVELQIDSNLAWYRVETHRTFKPWWQYVSETFLNRPCGSQEDDVGVFKIFHEDAGVTRSGGSSNEDDIYCVQTEATIMQGDRYYVSLPSRFQRCPGARHSHHSCPLLAPAFSKTVEVNRDDLTNEQLAWLEDEVSGSGECAASDLIGDSFTDIPRVYCAKLRIDGRWDYYEIYTDWRLKDWWQTRAKVNTFMNGDCGNTAFAGFFEMDIEEL